MSFMVFIEDWKPQLETAVEPSETVGVAQQSVLGNPA